MGRFVPRLVRAVVARGAQILGSFLVIDVSIVMVMLLAMLRFVLLRFDACRLLGAVTTTRMSRRMRLVSAAAYQRVDQNGQGCQAA